MPTIPRFLAISAKRYSKLMTYVRLTVNSVEESTKDESSDDFKSLLRSVKHLTQEKVTAVSKTQLALDLTRTLNEEQATSILNFILINHPNTKDKLFQGAKKAFRVEVENEIKAQLDEKFRNPEGEAEDTPNAAVSELEQFVDPKTGELDLEKIKDETKKLEEAKEKPKPTRRKGKLSARKPKPVAKTE